MSVPVAIVEMFEDLDNYLPEERAMTIAAVEEWKSSLEDMICAGMPKDTPVEMAFNLLGTWLNEVVCRDICQNVLTLHDKRKAVLKARQERDIVMSDKLQLVNGTVIVHAVVGIDMKVRRGGLDASQSKKH